MRPDSQQPASATWSLIALPIAVAVATFVLFVVRDGFAPGDLVGAVVIGLATFAVMLVIRRATRR